MGLPPVAASDHLRPGTDGTAQLDSLYVIIPDGPKNASPFEAHKNLPARHPDRRVEAAAGQKGAVQGQVLGQHVGDKGSQAGCAGDGGHVLEQGRADAPVLRCVRHGVRHFCTALLCP